jgi:cytochrome P450 family 107 subfamily K polypeptide 1
VERFDCSKRELAVQNSDGPDQGPIDPLYREYSEHRERAAVHVVDAAGGPRYCLYRYGDVAAAFKDARFGAAPASLSLRRALRWTGLGSFADVIESGLLVAINPPGHTRLRKIIGPFFRDLENGNLKLRVEEIADRLLERLQKAGQFDLIADFAALLPTRIIAELIGFPQADMARLMQWTERLAPLVDSDLQRSALTRRVAAFLGFRRRVKELIKERWREPRKDLMSALAHAHYVTGELSQAEIVGTAILLLTAGHATTTHLIGTGILSLLNHPRELDRLQADPSLIDRATEEMLRFNSPILRTGRVLLEEIELHGQRIPRGAKVRLMIGAANRDPRRFENPDRFDVLRSRNQHLGFGAGIHQCIGLQLARIETKVAIGALVQRFPKLARVSEEIQWVKGTKFRGLAEFAVRI